MLEFKQIEVEEVPYLYEERSCAMNPEDIGKTMGSAFHSVMAFMQSNGIQTTGKVLSVYYTYNPNTITFRSGFSVNKDDMPKAQGDIKSDVTPAGTVLTFTHVGPYSDLRDSYGEMMKHIEDEGLQLGSPTWEVYVDDPSTTPAAELRTEVFVSLLS